MRVKLRFGWTIIACCGVLITLTTSCSHRIELKTTADSSPKPIVREIARDEQVPLVVDSIDTTRNGSPQNSPLETEHRVLGTLRGVGLFSRLGDMNSPEPPASEKFIRARLSFDEAIDSHAGDVTWKSIAIGASMFTLAPFIPLEYDYSAHMTLELERWDGRVKRYESRSAGTAHYKMFGATPLMIDELKGHVTESCLTALMEQVVRDTAFYTASSAPILDQPIRSVSVKSKRAAFTSVPVATSSGK
ncbi:MAG TPA: hypothetical protein VJU02_05155 [Nitrospiraceae bacterium]|nr:hypothetical protein [Nitrospiraceae bacterium]